MTARDVIAKTLADRFNDEHDPVYLQDADDILRALAAAPDSVRQELVGLLNPWRPIETAPRDGTPFLAWCIERGPFSLAPTYFCDVAKWLGKTPDDRIGRFASRSGAIVAKWQYLPIPPKEEKE